MEPIKYLLILVLVFQFSFADEVPEQIDAVVGHSVELPCNVIPENIDDNLTILAWYRNSSSTAFYSRDLRNEDTGDIASAEDTKGRYRFVVSEGREPDKLQIISVTTADGGLYRCVAIFASSPTEKTLIQVNVIEPPERLWVSYENGTRSRVATARPGANTSIEVGPYYVADIVYLFCVAYGGKPLASLQWWSEQRLLKDGWTPLSEQRVRSDLQYGPLRREDHGLVLTCLANNNNKTLPLSVDVIIDMYLSPELVSVRDITESTSPNLGDGVGGRVAANGTLRLQCRVLGARPTPSITWHLNNAPLLNLLQDITMEPSQRLVVSEIELTVTRDHDEARVTCCAPANTRGGDLACAQPLPLSVVLREIELTVTREHDGARLTCCAPANTRGGDLTCAQPLPLSVVYKPIVEIVTEMDLENDTLSAVKGSDVTLFCSFKSNPVVFQVDWIQKHEGGEKNIETDNNNSDTILQKRLELELVNVTEDDAGAYMCSAKNDEGTSLSKPVILDITYPAYCTDEKILEYGIAENEFINITCNVAAHPSPVSYTWRLTKHDTVNGTMFRVDQPHTLDHHESWLMYQRLNDTKFTTISCWGWNGVNETRLPHTPCTFLITDQTVPQPPTDCIAVKSSGEIAVHCEKGHDGGLPQKFNFEVRSLDSDDLLVSIVNVDPRFIIQEPKEDNYKFRILAFNEKGNSTTIVEINKDSIIDQDGDQPKSAVSNITILALALCGGVLLIALAACGLVLCAHDRGSVDLPRTVSDPPLCAYNTEESNCETFHDSDEGSEYNVRRTESFRRAMARYPTTPKNYDVRRTSSFHSTRYLNDMDEGATKCSDGLRHSSNCRVHSLQSLNRKREMEALCDHLVVRLPPEPNYQVSKPMNTFYTMPRKMRNKAAKQIRDDMSEITQTSDGFSLPPPPDEFGTYRAGTRIKDIPTKSSPHYSTINRRKSIEKVPTKQQYNDKILSPMNTVGVPTITGSHSVYTYPDDDHPHNHPVTTNPFDDSS